jgi:cation diffusion facilitator family transporter
MAESRSVVIAALVANIGIAALKFVGYLLTGSAAMLSETYHSISDTGNQIFLLIGIRFAERGRDRRHPFGYGKAQFFYSFLVSVLLFGIAGWESAKQGYAALTSGTVSSEGTVSLLGYSFPGVWVNYGVLAGALVFEAYALRQAYLEMSQQIDDHGWSGFREAFRKTSDVTTLTALTEDTVATSGAGIALLGVYLSCVTGNPVYDAAAALFIGFLLMAFAVALAWENKRLLLGESLPADDEHRLRELVADFEGVDAIVDFRTVYFGPEEVIVTADVAFDANLDTDGIDDRISAIESGLMETNPQVRKVYIEPET